MKKSFLATAASGITLAALTLSGCAATPEPEAEATKVASSAPATPSASKRADMGKGDPAQTGNKPGDVINGLPTKKELAHDGKGYYIQTTIAADDPAMQYNPSIVSPDVFATFTEEDVKDFQRFAVTFIAEESLDSTLNDNHSDAATQDAWWAKNQDKFHPDAHADMLSSLRANTPDQPIVFRAQLRGIKYSLVNGENVTHMHSRNITPTLIRSGTMNGKAIIGLQANVEFSMNASYAGNTVVEASNGQVSYTASKDESGRWQFTGFYSTYNTTPVVT